MKNSVKILVLMAVTLTFIGSGCATKTEISLPALTGQNLTPLIGRALVEPRPVKLSDGKTYLMYELMVTNATTSNYAINKLALKDPLNKDAAIAEYNVDEIMAHLRPAPKEGPTNIVKAHETVVITFSLSLEGKKVPKAIDHILSVKTDTPISILPAETDERIARTRVDTTPPVVIGPPLDGDNWLAANVADNYGHRNAFFPMNGGWIIPERWAVDYVKLDNDNRVVTGDINDLNSYPAYNRDLLAVNDGTVIKVVDEFPDLEIGKTLENMSLANLGGNYILLDIGNGYTAFYAHIIKGTMKVKEGEKVKRGQVLAKLGNSGNSTGPHLHFHIVKGTDPIADQGMPYVINNFEVTKQASAAPLPDEFFTGAPLQTTANFKGAHKNEMPADSTVVTFKKPKPKKETKE